MTTIRDLLMGQQETLLTKLDFGRKVHSHPTDLGDATELDWVGTLQDFLPERYRVAKARVLDCHDKISDQVDVVVFDRQYCPLWFDAPGVSKYIPAESVYAVFEVKQDLTADKKIESVRKLHRTNRKVVHAGGVVSAPKKPFRIVGGILTSQSSWSPPFGDAFRKAMESREDLQTLDIGCALRHGAFDIAVEDPKEGSEVVEPTSRSPGDPLDIVVGEADASLMFFLMRLFNRLQALGTVPVIDLATYAQTLEAAEEDAAPT